jgi:deoxyribodipyrimidine photo-lyase
MEKITLFWFRRDLRIEDNCGLFHALNGKNKVLPIFIFDKKILKKLPKQDARLEMILMSLNNIDLAMKTKRCSVGRFHGTPKTIFPELIKKWRVEKVICNEDYEPYATNRDAEIHRLLEKEGVAFEMYKDQVIFAKDEIVKKDGSPYKVYTPFSRKWLERFEENALKTYPSETLLGNLTLNESLPKINLADLGFDKSTIVEPKYSFDNKVIDEYEETRNFPSLDSTSRLGSYLRFGIVSVRALVQKAASRSNHIFLKELIWREFFMQILWHFPHTSHKSFKPQYDKIEWLNNPVDFEKWCKGDTGYPLVDAGMRQLNQTGFMHNRVRMLVGSFLCKHLLIDWRWGEAYFAEKLLDYEMSSNVGNWQWVAGCGVDAAPYFRIFNPSEQVKKFDKELRYIQKWVPNFQEIDYPAPMIDHKKARERCLMVYKTALSTL